MKKRNCWEHKKCGREPGGGKVDELGVCPVSKEVNLNGTHGGRNGGRACWVVAGSYCGGERQGTYAQKFESCGSCDFYRAVKGEEQASFELSAVLLRRVRGDAGRSGVAPAEGSDLLRRLKRVCV